MTASVVVPVRDGERLIAGCLRSLSLQDFPREDYEIIVVDDGSTDTTAEVVEQFPHVRLIAQPPLGPAAARNRGIRAARGEIVLFTDADCEPTPHWLDEMVRPFEELDVVGVKGSYRTHQRQVVPRLAQCEFEERYDLLERSSAIDFVDSYAAAFRTEALRGGGGFDPAFPDANNEDVDLSYRLARMGHRLVFNRQAVVYHRHPASWGAYLRLKIKRGYWRMIVYRYHASKALRDSYTPQLLKIQILLAWFCVILTAVMLTCPTVGWAAGLCLASFVLSAIPFTRLVVQRDAKIAIWAPVFVWGRALALAVGLAGGLVGILFFRRALPAIKT